MLDLVWNRSFLQIIVALPYWMSQNLSEFPEIYWERVFANTYQLLRIFSTSCDDQR